MSPRTKSKAIIAYSEADRNLAIQCITESLGDPKDAYELMTQKLYLEHGDKARIPSITTFNKWLIQHDDAYAMASAQQKREIQQLSFKGLRKGYKYIMENIEDVPPSKWPELLRSLTSGFLDITEGRAKNGSANTTNVVVQNFQSPRQYMDFVNKVGESMQPIEGEVVETT